jgi:hypothetical protein
MGQLGDALRSAARALESRLRAHDGALLHDGLSEFLPQSWRFTTQSEVAVLRIAPDGRVSVVDDVSESPDVIVQWDQTELVAALLAGRSNETARARPPQIRFANARGRKAFSMVGTSLGL